MTARYNRIIHGDCITGLKKLADGCVDLAFADPPFNIGYDYDEYDDKRTCDDYLDWSRQWMAQVVRVLKSDGAFWLAIGDDYAAELKVAATRELGLTCRNWVVWYYTFGVHCKAKFTRSHTHLFYFVKDAKTFTFNDDQIRVPSARQLVYGDKRANPKGRVPDDTWIIPPVSTDRAGAYHSRDGTDQYRDRERAAKRRGETDNDKVGDAHPTGAAGLPTAQGGTEGGRGGLTHNDWYLRPQDLPDGFSPDSDTWYFPRVCGTFKERKGFHGCQMPEQLLARIIRACSNEGELVLDPFSGSATTLAVAKKLHRRFLGFELSQQYVDEGRARLKRSKPGDALDGFENPLTTAPNTANGTIRTGDGKRVKANGRPRQNRRGKQESPGQEVLWGTVE